MADQLTVYLLMVITRGDFMSYLIYIWELGGTDSGGWIDRLDFNTSILQLGV